MCYDMYLVMKKINTQHFGKLSIHYQTIRLVCKDFHGQLSSSARCLILFFPTIDYQECMDNERYKAKTGGILIEKKNRNNNIKTIVIDEAKLVPHVKTFVCYIFWDQNHQEQKGDITLICKGVCAIDTSKLLDVFVTIMVVL